MSESQLSPHIPPLPEKTWSDVVQASRQAMRPRLTDRVERILRKFLGVPLGLIAVMLLIAWGTLSLDKTIPQWLAGLRDTLQRLIFTDAQSTADVLSTLGSGMITLTSITTSMLLLSLQQAAGKMGNMIYDQFLYRHRNQVYLGFTLGNVIYTLMIFAAASEVNNPVLSATLALIFGFISLTLLAVFIYSTINQMRPEVVIHTVHDQTLNAWEHQQELYRRTRRSPQFFGSERVLLRSAGNGYITGLDMGKIAENLEQVAGNAEVEIELYIVIGSYLTYHDGIALVKANDLTTAQLVAHQLAKAMEISIQREIRNDPALGVKQLEMIAWTEISTARDNPEAGMLGIRALRDLIARWVAEEYGSSQRRGTQSAAEENNVERDVPPSPDALPVVYNQRVIARALDALASLAVVSSESMQHHNFTEIVHALALLYPRLPAGYREQVEDICRRIMSALGDHVLTADLERSLNYLVQVLSEEGSEETAAMVQRAWAKMGGTLGELNSRSTRAQIA